MTTEDRKLQLGVAVDATGAKQGFDQVKAGAREMAAEVAKSGTTAAQGIDGVGEATRKLTAEQTKVVESIRRTTVVTTEGKGAWLEQRAAMAGVSAEAAPYIAKLKLAEQGTVQLGMSAKATSAALRQVPAQFTDIVTSLAAGQRPMQVFLQQGGQLKDVFGGVGPAVRALTGYVLGLVNPVTLAAGAIALVGSAAYMGSQELRGFQNQVTLTGGAIGVSASQFAGLRDSLSGIATKGKAAEVLTEIAAAAKIASGNVQLVAEAAILMEKATGQPIAKTVQQFATLADEPAKAAAKLNETYNFLTLSVYNQIKALEDQGRATEAANLAEQTFAGALTTRAQTVIENAGLMEKAWRGIVGTAKAAWDAMLGVGRDSSPADRLAQAAADVARIQAQIAGVGAFGETGGGAATGGASAARKAALEAELRLANEALTTARRRVEIEHQNTQAKEEQNRLVQMGIAVSQREEGRLSKQVRMQREIAAEEVVYRELIIAGYRTEADLHRAIGAIREKYKESGSKADGTSELASMKARVIAEQTYLEQLRLRGVEADKLSEGERAVLLLQEQLKGKLDEKTRSIKEQVLAQAVLLAGIQRQTAAEKDGLKLQEDLRKAREKFEDQRDKYNAGVENEILKINDKARAVEDEVAVYGLNRQALEALTIARLEEQKVILSGFSGNEQKIDQINREIEARKRLARAVDAKEGIEEAARVSKKAAEDSEREWTRFTDSIYNGLSDSLYRGFEAGKGFFDTFWDGIKNTFKTTVLKLGVQGVMNMTGLSALSSTANGGGGMMGMAGNAYSAYTNGIGGGFLNGQGMFGSVGAGVFGNAGAYAATVPGLTATGAGSQAAMLAAQTGEFGVAGLNATSAAGGGSAMGGAAYAAGAAAAVAVIAYAAIEAWQSTRGEKRGGARFDYDALTGTSTISGAASGDRAAGSDDLVKSLLASTSTSLNEAFKSFGSAVTVAAVTGAYETSANGRGGVFSGGRLSDGSVFGETGSGSNYSPTSPFDSKYEIWGMEAGRFGASGSFDTNGDPAKLAVDIQQSYIAAIQASAGIIPRIVAETYQREIATTGSGFTVGASGYEGSPDSSPLTTDPTSTRWLRVFDAEMEQRARDLGLLPKKILDLIAGVDPEALSAEATAELTTKISTLVGNVNGFRTIVEALPVEQLKNVSFDVAASLVAAAGGLEAFGQGLSTYYENFYSEEEKRKAIAGNISQTLASAGVDFGVDAILSATRPQFRALVEGLDLNTEGGQKAYATLLSVSGAFASIVADGDGAAGVVGGISQALRSLQDQGASLGVDLLRAQGNGAGAAAAQRALDTAGFTEAEVAAYDFNVALRAQIQSLNDAAAASEAAARAEADRLAAVAQERASLERQLLDLQGDTVAIRDLERAALDETNRALYDQITALQDTQAAAAEAAQTEQALAADRARIAQERSGLERQLLQLQGDSVAIRALERAALDETNRALYDQITALQDTQAASAAATEAERVLTSERERVAQERTGLERQLLQLQGDTAALRGLERAALDETNRALYDQITALQDTQAAATAAAQAQQAQAAAAERIVQERLGLEQQLLQAQGDTAGLRDRERAALDASNRALYDQITALREATAAEEALATQREHVAQERTGLERQLLDLQGDTVAIRALERAAIDAANLALYDQITALRDTQAAAADATRAEQDLAAQRERVAQERTGLERQLLDLQGDTAALRAIERASLDATNRALYDQITALQDQRQAAEAAAAAEQELASRREQIAQERSGLERQILELQGNTAAVRALERAALDESNRALYDQITALQDSRQAAEAATAAEQELAGQRSRVAQERDGLLRELLGLQGNTAELRALERASLDASNRSLYNQIQALRDQQEASAKAAEAARELKQALESAGTSVAGEVLRLRELMTGGTAGSMATLQSQFAITSAQARAGDAKALAKLPEISQALEKVAGLTAVSALDVARTRGFLAGSLTETLRALGLDIPQYAAGGYHFGGARLVGERGPEIEVTPSSRIFNATDTSRMLGRDDAAIVAAIDGLRADQQAQASAIVGLQGELLLLHRRWDGDGLPEEREVTV